MPSTSSTRLSCDMTNVQSVFECRRSIEKRVNSMHYHDFLMCPDARHALQDTIDMREEVSLGSLMCSVVLGSARGSTTV